jgi:hypothetical protein
VNQLRSRRGGWSWCQAAKLDVIMGGHPFFLLPLMRKALLKRPNRRRVPGTTGRLCKRGAFANKLRVNYD